MRAAPGVAAATLLIAAASAAGSATATTELNERELFDSTIRSGKNGMVKFYQEWCGHCQALKPDWDRLAREADPSVFIADVDCGSEGGEQICEDNGVEGFPTIKYYKDGQEYPYEGGRDFDELWLFVQSELANPCDVGDLDETCSERAAAYARRWMGKDVDAVGRELERLEGMQEGSMAADLKSWLGERMGLLRQLKDRCAVDDLDGTCSERAAAYARKWMARGAADVMKEIDRLNGMKGEVMNDELRDWLKQRMQILAQLKNKGAEEL